MSETALDAIKIDRLINPTLILKDGLIMYVYVYMIGEVSYEW